MMGLLCAREYFDRDTPEEAAARSRISILWNEVEWSWFTQGGRDVLYWHWSPYNGWAMDHADSRLERVPHYIRACGVVAALFRRAGGLSPRLRERCRDFAIARSWYDIELPLGMPYGGPLFFTHYSFCGLDPRGLTDRYADYWAQNVHHVRINRAHCVANPGKFEGYGESCWGLTASDDPTGYSAHAPDNDNGTISPTAALASLPYAPAEVMTVLRHFLKRHGKRLWREFGFVDAFCESQNWYADTFLAIDQGPIIVMIENHRTGLLWKLFMAVPEVQAGLRRLGFSSPHLEAARAVTESLEQWLGREYRHAATAMLTSVSARDIVKERPGFGQTVRPVAGSIVASPVLGVLGSGSGLLLSLVPRLGDRHRRRAPALRSRTPRRGGAHALRRFRALQSVSESARWARARRVAALATEGDAGLRAIPARR